MKDDWYFGGTTKYLSFLSPGDLILDIGCAGGAKTNDLVKEGFKVVGIDISEKMIEIAKKEVPAGKFYVLDLDSVGKLEDEFDGIIMRAVLLHVPKKRSRRKT